MQRRPYKQSRKIVAVAALLLAAFAAGCTPGYGLRPASLFDTWRTRLEIVPADEITSGEFIQPGAKVPPGHKVLLTGASVREIHIMHVKKRGTWLELVLDNEGRQTFADITGRGNGEQLLFVVDGTVLSAPTITEPITTGHFAVPLDYSTPTPDSPPPPILPAP